MRGHRTRRVAALTTSYGSQRSAPFRRRAECSPRAVPAGSYTPAQFCATARTSARPRTCLLPGRVNLRPIRPEDESRLICRPVCLMCGDEMSDGGWGAGDVKPSNALLDGAITDDDALMLP